MSQPNAWPDPLPIEEAKPGEKVLAWMWGSWRVAEWDPDKFAKKPRPFWSADDLSITSSREHQPRWWLPLPPRPIQEP